ncbi:hypothetical protein [Paenibacillus protaetiae]|uniref:hypothetical protein n=1 Tax=Paenibacillus protaetiae TaxID=2509456 RepID=UPI0013EC5B50|nr:hypothetical protein [Paenibacillus protaetiae]
MSDHEVYDVIMSMEADTPVPDGDHSLSDEAYRQALRQFAHPEADHSAEDDFEQLT